MASRPHIAAVLEDAVFGRVEALLRGRGWCERVIGYTGYGTGAQARILARVVLTRAEERGVDSAADAGASEGELREAEAAQRGWRAFIIAPAVETPVRIELGSASMQVATDRGGNVDVTIAGHGLAPGWHEARLTSAEGASISTSVWIIDASIGLGVVSDIDDTVMITHLPRPLIAGWNTFVRSEQAREVVPGMAALYRSLLADRPGAPIFYLSTGAWNTAPTLTRFLRRHFFPSGPLLLTDWGPTNTGWFRSGQQHKKDQLHRLLREFPAFRWILVGDDGQHDPAIYGEFSEQHPEAVEAVAIRQLTPAQQVLSHGLPVATDELLGRRHGGVPMLRAADGYTLHQLIQNARRALGRGVAGGSDA
ncbi:MAG: DUF2183 domain-containing protein [Actinomycetota bacterium]|nr:DUF2183 domain-containing protein [Actinomycetota bacterium]